LNIVDGLDRGTTVDGDRGSEMSHMMRRATAPTGREHGGPMTSISPRHSSILQYTNKRSRCYSKSQDLFFHVSS